MVCHFITMVTELSPKISVGNQLLGTWGQGWALWWVFRGQASVLQIKTQTWVLCIPEMVTQVEELPFYFENGHALLSFLPGQKATTYLKLLKCLRAKPICSSEKQLRISSSVWASIQWGSRTLGLEGMSACSLVSNSLPLHGLQFTPEDWHQAPLSVRFSRQEYWTEWVAISFSKGSSWCRDRTCISCIDRWILYHWATWEAPWGHENMLLAHMVGRSAIWVAWPWASILARENGRGEG